MSPKTLRVDGITNELEGASLYFNPLSKPEVEKSNLESPDLLPAVQKTRPAPLKELKGDVKLRDHASMIASKHDSKQASMIASKHASKQASTKASKQASTKASTIANKLVSTIASKHGRDQDDFIETIRKSVKKVGRETLFVRLIPEEKNELRSIVRRFNALYRGEGGETSENEVTRIALEFLLADYKTNDEHSLLFVIQEALHA